MNEVFRDLFRNESIRASAGTGKTFALSNRYLRLLVSGVDCHEILATTFTRKGAGEILDRIIERLSNAALDDGCAERLSGELGWQLDRARASLVLNKLLGDLHRLEISTLDSFFNRVAQAFSLELGLPPSWEIVEEQQIDALRDRAIQQILRSETVVGLIHLMAKGEVQRRIATLVRDTVKSSYGIFRESDEEAWNQIPDLGRFMTAEELNKIIGDIEGVEFKDKRVKKQVDKDVLLGRQEKWDEFCANSIFQRILGDGLYYNKPIQPDLVKRYLQILPHCQKLITNRLIQQNTSTYELMKLYGEIFEASINESGSLRFDDITQRLLLFVSMWDTDRFSFRLDNKIQHLLLDEFQDTSPAQWSVIKPFAEKVTQDAPDHSFFCVGDVKQAIFGWRGGVAEIFDLAENQLENLQAGEPLTQSYRSSPVVIEMVNEVFGNLDKFNSNHDSVDPSVHNWSKCFSSHSTARDYAGHATVSYAPDCDPNEYKGSGRYSDENLKHYLRNENVLDETVAKVKKLTEEMPGKSIGVLVRTNAAVGRLIFRLQQMNVDASEEGGNPLTDSAAVEVVLSAIQLADHPGDSVARFHLSYSPLAEQLGLTPETPENQKANINATITASAELRRQLMVDGFGPAIERLARCLIEKCTRRELLRLQQLIRVAYQYNDQWSLRVSQFVSFVREECKVSDQSSADVRVMTIHKSKGLEFDIVVIPMLFSKNGWLHNPPPIVVGRENPTDPVKMVSRWAKEAHRSLLPQEIQDVFDEDRKRSVREAMCVLYVALTRAVHAVHVVLSWSAGSSSKSKKVEHHRSDAGLLIATLTDGMRREGVVYEHGDPDWFKKPKPETSEEISGLRLEEFYLAEDASLRTGTVSGETRTGRGLPAKSPSSLEGGAELQLSSLFSDRDRKDALDFGTLIHGCFELIDWLDYAEPTDDQIVKQLLRIDPTIESTSDIVKSFRQMLALPNVNELMNHRVYLTKFLPAFLITPEIMHDEFRVEVQNERPFAVNLENGMLQGFIDRLILVYQGDSLIAADVIDFKTDACADDQELAVKLKYYRPQLEAYRLAVSHFAKLPLAAISTRLVFVHSDQILDVQFDAEPSTKNNPYVDSVGKKNVVPSPKGLEAGSGRSPRQLKLWTDE